MKKIFLAAAIITLATSCQKDYKLMSESSRIYDEINIQTNLDFLSRAEISDSDLENFSLSVNQEGEEKDYNVLVKKDENETWKSYKSNDATTEETMLWHNINSPVEIIAVYKNNLTDITVNGEISGYLPEEQDVNTINEHEILYCSENVHAGDNGTLNVMFKHLFSKIQINPDFGNMTEEVELQSISIYQVYNKYVFSPNTGTIELDIDYGTKKISPFIVEGTQTYEALILPQDMKNSFISVVFKLPNQNNPANKIEYKQTAKFPTDFKLESGTKYIIDLTVEDPRNTVSRSTRKNMEIKTEEWSL